MVKKVKVVSTIAVAAVLCATVAQANMGGGGGKPPAPEFGKMAKDLGLSEDQVKSCFPKPAAQGSGPPERPDMSKVSSCLKKGNAKLTDGQIEKVLKKYEPKGPSRG